MEQISSVLGIELSSFVQYSEPCFTPKLQYDVVRVNNFHDSVADLAKFAKKCLKDSENDVSRLILRVKHARNGSSNYYYP